MNLGKETETLEFKKSTGEIKEAMISISSILNKHGIGTLYFGVKPNGDAIGQEVSESSLRDVSRAIYESIKPQIYPAIKEEIVDDKHIIKVEFNGDNRPYSAYGKYYLRTADEDREANPTELKNFFVANEYKEKWEKSLTDIPIDKVDNKTIDSFCNKAISVGRMPEGNYTANEILNRFGLARDGYLTNAGNVLFGSQEPVTVRAAVFATDEKLTFLDIQRYEDNIFNLLKTTESYIFKNIRWRVEFNGMDREEIPEVPVDVVREVLANSFAHATYNGNTYHEICIFPSKITIYSPGEYASSHLPEDYINDTAPSSLRNETISKMLYINKTIEQFGSGFRRIDSLCKDANVKYSYQIMDTGFMFTLYRNNDLSIIQNQTKKIILTDIEIAVYTLLESNPYYTRESLASATAKSTRTIQRTLNSLKDKGLIERVGDKNGGYWKIINK